MSTPNTRLRARKQNGTVTTKEDGVLPPGGLSATLRTVGNHTQSSDGRVAPLSLVLTTKHTKLSPRDHKLLLHKQSYLKTYDLKLPVDFRKQAVCVDATLVFAQAAAGTAVCVSRDGLLLTCAHCVADEDDERPHPKSAFWLLFASGRAVAARCVAWDERRDLALLRVVAAQAEPRVEQGAVTFPSVVIADTAPRYGDRLVCVGHPGSEDLEGDESGLATGYDVLYLSNGSFRGYAEGQNLQDNSEIGALQHDCWTYWGHSGAPLLEHRTGKLVGLHSSWDDETGMRRGIALEAIRAFVEENSKA